MPVTDYVEGIRAELAMRAPACEPWELDTLYFGGGTPSRLGGDGVARLLDVLRERVAWNDAAEVTLETNPDDVTEQSARAWRAAGVSRVSLGAQSFQPAALEWMRRTHGADQIRRAVDLLRGAGIGELSIDLIFALPETVPRVWERDLEQALALRPHHLSVYGLTVESHTPLGHGRDRGELAESPDSRYEREFLLADETLGDAGYEHYEVSNYALSGARARHNSSYWRHVPYAALGPAAHRFDGMKRSWNVAPYAEWLRRTAARIDPTEGEEALTAAELDAERVYIGLRTTGGLVVTEELRAHSARWLDARWAKIEDGRLRLTPLGWLRLDSLALDLTQTGSR